MKTAQKFSKILVTGGCGFIGANLIPMFANDAEEIVAFDNLSRGSKKLLDGTGTEIIRGDILNRRALQAAMAGVDAVIHLAAFGSVVESVKEPVPNFDNNAAGTFNVLDCARLAGVRKVIFASTGGALIGNAEPPVNEQSLPKPISPYGASKLCGEAYCHAFSQSYGMETVSLRFANVYGPFSAHKKGAVTVFIRALLTGEPIMIYGDGQASRDFLYAEDLCRGIRQALLKPLQPGAVMHLAAGNEVRIADLARLIARIGGNEDHPIEYLERRPGEVERNAASYDLANELIGFEPQVSLEAGMQRTWDWFVEQDETVMNVVLSDS